MQPALGVDPNVVYPIGTTFALILFGIVGLKYFATSSDLASLRAEIAEKYMLKDESKKLLEDFKKDMRDMLQDIKSDITRLYDKMG